MKCPVCNHPLKQQPQGFSNFQCPACQRHLLRSPRLARLSGTGTYVPYNIPITVLSCGLTLLLIPSLFLAQPLNISIKLPLFAILGLLLPLSFALGWDGFLSIKTGLDKTKNHLSQGAEARFTGLTKICLSLALTGMAICGLLTIFHL